MIPDSPGMQRTKRFPFIQEVLSSHQQNMSSESSSQQEASMECLPSLHDHNKGEEVGGGSSKVESIADLQECIKNGQLLKTSCRRLKGSKSGPTKLGWFRLTEEALEYFQQLSDVSPLWMFVMQIKLHSYIVHNNYFVH